MLITGHSGRVFPSDNWAMQHNSTCFKEPSGTRKTTIVRQLCNMFPDGVLYHEIAEMENFMELLTGKWV